MKRMKGLAVLCASAVTVSALGGCGKQADQKGNQLTLTNVSYDPTRELYEAYNLAFAKHWKDETGQEVEIIQSHGGSGKQALEVANGLPADVVTLALEYDITSIQKTGLIDEGWADEYKYDSAPYTSTIVFLVRKGNPKDIRDWDDLISDDVKLITPNPKTSGGARWNYLAAWAFAEKKYGEDKSQIKKYIKKIYQNVLVLDSGARGATTSFVENGQGDVLIAWENEAYLSLRDSDDFEIVTPSVSILAQPSVAVVDEVVDERGTRKAAEEYLKYLYSAEGQKIAAENYYRPTNTDILKEYADVFQTDINLVTIEHFGGWERAQKEHFSDGGVFDEIYEK
ncbi:sulfate ABC transporter substrate-binding protein [Blautia liquoris]|uniref:Sulfate-binding protein n=1 Tax=Blautia liquoris TaxID=2779518 RepID=A0A7M2RFV2_9FIRM|nr:sulfate ABC transporter substrate-binding protein [Blautia liquoris]QOV19018.1 sulfate ABC transporter substrate-binding protein [Blautia liquoris]